jgi:hypothetical protein
MPLRRVRDTRIAFFYMCASGKRRHCGETAGRSRNNPRNGRDPSRSIGCDLVHY